MTDSLDRVGEWMRLMTKVYGPRDLREAYMMPREDAVWIMEHCADEWESDLHSLKLAREDHVTQWLEISRLRKLLEDAQADNAALRDECQVLRQRLEAAEQELADITQNGATPAGHGYPSSFEEKP